MFSTTISSRKKISRSSYFRHVKNETDRVILLINDKPKVIQQNNLTSNNFSENHDSIQKSNCVQEIPIELDTSDDSESYVTNDFESELFEIQSNVQHVPFKKNCTLTTSNITLGNKCESNLLGQLGEWGLSNRIKHSSLGSLLKILKPYFNELPTDARTLLKTPRSTVTRKVHPGEYYHFGLEHATQYLLNNTTRENITDCEICVNIDGLPLSKSSGSQFYPILISLFPVEGLVGVVGIYHGYEKPQNVNSFLRDFVDEAKLLTINGILFNNNVLSFKIRAFICDAPAKAFVKCIKNHNAYFSCTKCLQEGDYINHKVCFPEINFIERTDNSFISKNQDEHHIGTSILEEIPKIGLISSFPLDYMHLLCLGVTKKLLVSLWIFGRPPHKISAFQINQISESLLQQSKNIPVEFCRKPRSLHEVKRWKATEFRQFLLYTGPIVLKSVLNENQYLNFIALHVAVRILCTKEANKLCKDYANSLMIYFVKSFAELYGNEFISHNVHNLLHISKDSCEFGNLDSFSAFPFENFMQTIKKHVRKSDRPLAQVVRRLKEVDKSNIKNSIPHFSLGPFKEHYTGPLIINCHNPQFLEYHYSNFKLKTIHPDNCCKLIDGSIVLIENFATKDNNIVVIGRKYKNVSNFFSKPCNSSDMGIFIVNDLGILRNWAIDQVELKYVQLMFRDEFVVLPLLHLEK